MGEVWKTCIAAQVGLLFAVTGLHKLGCEAAQAGGGG